MQAGIQLAKRAVELKPGLKVGILHRTVRDRWDEGIVRAGICRSSEALQASQERQIPARTMPSSHLSRTLHRVPPP